MPVLDRIDPAYLPILTMLPVIDLADLPAARQALQAMFAQVGSPPPHPDVETADYHAPGLPGEPEVLTRLFKPRGAAGPLPLLYWIQGGGYVLTAPDLDDALCETIAHDLQCAVISVAWRRAPEAPFPAAHNDCYAGLLWAVRNASDLGIDTGRVIVGGASSGAGAAAGVALRVRDEGEIAIIHQLLIYPMLDDRQTTPSSRNVTDRPLWNRADNEVGWRAYLGDSYNTHDVSPYAAPARVKDVAGLASATMLTGELDLFVDENIEYAQRLMHAGVPTELHMYPAVHHGFDRHNPTAATSRRFFADRDAALARAFATA